MESKKRNFRCALEKREVMQLTYNNDRKNKAIDFYIVGGDSSVTLEEKELKMLYDTIGAVLRK